MYTSVDDGQRIAIPKALCPKNEVGDGSGYFAAPYGLRVENGNVRFGGGVAVSISA